MLKIIFEPGRSIIGNVGYLLTKIIYIKKTNRINFIILDAGMNDFDETSFIKLIIKLFQHKKIIKKF